MRLPRWHYIGEALCNARSAMRQNVIAHRRNQQLEWSSESRVCETLIHACSGQTTAARTHAHERPSSLWRGVLQRSVHTIRTKLPRRAARELASCNKAGADA